MGKIFYIMGKSSTGKDTIYINILNRLTKEQNIKTITIYTTRNMRVGESEGEQYHFVSDEEWDQLNRDGKIIESRTYERVQDVVKYFTVDDENLNLDIHNYIGIGTLDSYEQICEYYGAEKVVPIYIQVDNQDRLLRAINREAQQDVENQNFQEVCRRYIADENDFSEEKLERLGVKDRFENSHLHECVNKIAEHIVNIVVME